MSKPRPSRWLSIPDVTDIVLQRSNKVAERLRRLSRREQLRSVRRMVQRAERRDDTRITKRVAGDVYVRLDAVEALLPVDVATVTRLELDVVNVASETKRLWKHVGSHGSRLREHDKRISAVEEEQALTTKYLKQISEIRSRAKVG